MPVEPGPVSGAGDGPEKLPVGLATMPPGPELAEALEAVSPRRVSGRDTVDLARAAYRQACRSRAVFLLALLETGMREAGSADGVVRVESPGEFAAEEARAALVWSRRRADASFGFAWDVFERLPMLGEAMLAGRLDEPRAQAFCQWTVGLTDDQAAQVCAALLPEAPGLLVGELIDRIKRMAVAIDPDWAERRYRQAVRGRRVVGSQNPDGSGNVAGQALPVDRAAAACDRVDALARACKRAGDDRRMDHIRVDLFLGMLDGTFEGMSDAQIVEHVLAHPFSDLFGNEPSGGTNDGRRRDGPDGSRGGGSGAGPGGRGGPRGRTDPEAGGGAGPGGAGPGEGDQPAAARAGDPSRSSGSGGSGDATPSGGSGDATPGGYNPAGPGRAWSVRECRVELATLVGWNDHPGEIPGWGFVPAGLARHLAARMGSAQWRWVVCDQDGRPVTSGITAARPCLWHARPRRDARRGGVVEIQVRERDLDRLAAEPLPVWAELAADVIAQHRAAVARAAEGSSDVDVDALRRRVAGAWLRRSVQVRDRTCVHPACRAPAVGTDQDHALDYARGGVTAAFNLGACCRRDHRLRHDGGWTVRKPAADRTEWASPLGHSYPSRPPPVIPPLPKPWPAGDGGPLLPEDGDGGHGIAGDGEHGIGGDPEVWATARDPHRVAAPPGADACTADPADDPPPF